MEKEQGKAKTKRVKLAQIHLHVEQEFKDKIVEAAKKDHRTATSWIEWVILQQFRNSGE